MIGVVILRKLGSFTLALLSAQGDGFVADAPLSVVPDNLAYDLQAGFGYAISYKYWQGYANYHVVCGYQPYGSPSTQLYDGTIAVNGRSVWRNESMLQAFFTMQPDDPSRFSLDGCLYATPGEFVQVYRPACLHSSHSPEPQLQLPLKSSRLYGEPTPAIDRNGSPFYGLSPSLDLRITALLINPFYLRRAAFAFSSWLAWLTESVGLSAFQSESASDSFFHYRQVVLDRACDRLFKAPRDITDTPDEDVQQDLGGLFVRS